jgi:hypothetical protein
VDPVSFFGPGDDEPKLKRKLNRRERRAQAAQNRREAKQQIKRIERRAKKRFEALQKAQAAEESPEVAEEYGFG